MTTVVHPIISTFRNDLVRNNKVDLGNSCVLSLQTPYIDIVKGKWYDSTIPSKNPNLLENGDFELWSSGETSPPDGWGLFGAGGEIARSTIHKVGIYSAAMTRAGTNCYLKSVVSNYAKYKNQTVSLGIWVNTAVTNNAKLQIYDGVGYTFSSYHAGNGEWEFLKVSHTLDSNATLLDVRLISYVDTVCYFDGAILVEGPDCPYFSSQVFTSNTGDIIGAVRDSDNKGLYFDGIDDYVNCGHDNSLNITEDVSVCSWVKLNTPINLDYIIAKGDYTSTGNYHLTIEDTNIQFYAGNTKVEITGYIDNKFHHIVGVYNGSHVIIYIDGVFKAQTVKTGSLPSTDFDLTLGGRVLGSRTIDGSINDIRIYNKTLSIDEIKLIYNQTKSYYQ